MVGEHQLGVDLIDDLRQASGDVLGIPEKVVEAAARLVLECRDHAPVRRSEEVAGALVAGARLGPGIAPCAQAQLDVPEPIAQNAVPETAAVATTTSRPASRSAEPTAASGR